MSSSCCCPWLFARVDPDRSGKEDFTVTDRMRRDMGRRSSRNPDPDADVLDLGDLLLKRDPKQGFSTFYRTTGELGHGAFGKVLKARSLVTQEERAVKVIKKNDIVDDMNMLATELEAMVLLSHPNIVQFFEYFENSRQICIVCELCQGGDFAQLREKALPEGRLQLNFRDVLTGIAYCHSLDIAHRDLKFENCLLANGKNRMIGKVIDFGLASIRKIFQSNNWCTESLGTKYFVAPEVIRGERYGVKCDLWSIGVMLYIIRTGEHPFAAHATRMSTGDLFQQIVSKQVRIDPMDKRNVEPDARDLMCRLLSKDYETRLCATEANEHRWLSAVADVDGNAAEILRLQKKLSGRLSSYDHLSSEFDKVLLLLGGHFAQADKVDELRQVFTSLDVHATGKISRKDLRQGLEKVNTGLSDDEFNRTFDAIDLDHNDFINYAEWVSATIEPKLVEAETAVAELFNFIDQDSSGTISFLELTKLVSDTESREVLAKYDKNHDDAIDRKEFKAIMKHLVEHRL